MANEGRSLKRKMRLAILTERTDVAGPDVAIFKFKPKEGELFHFAPGQYATLGLDVGSNFIARAYSIASSPYTRDHLEFYINVITEGQLTPPLFQMQAGDEIYYMGAKGIFTLKRTKARHLLFLATGTGLAPYMSMLRTLHLDECRGKPHGKTLTLLHGVRYSEDLGYRAELEALARDEGFNFLYLPLVSRVEQDLGWIPALGRGRVTAILELICEDLAGRLVSALPENLDPREVFARFPREDTAVYLCGNPEMTADAKAILQGKGYPEVFTEDYW